MGVTLAPPDKGKAAAALGQNTFFFKPNSLPLDARLVGKIYHQFQHGNSVAKIPIKIDFRLVNQLLYREIAFKNLKPRTKSTAG